MTSFHESFPNLRDSKYHITSPQDPSYNCIAWAIGRSDLFVWPDKYNQMFWPLLCPREETINAFTNAFRFFGYVPCDDKQQEDGFEKIALYARENIPKHAARQLKNGRWTSKLGPNIDIEHNLLDLEGPEYGCVVMFFRRPTQ